MPLPSFFLRAGVILSILSVGARAIEYKLQDVYAGSSFFDGFNFVTEDSTDGFVQYVDQQTATNARLIKAIGADTYIGVDYTTPLTTMARGRSSVRIESKKTYNHGLFILDLKHMPGGICGTWPTFASFGERTAFAKGEIDIVQGVNTDSKNQMALHTDTQCKTNGVGQSGVQSRFECALDSMSGAAGCGVTAVATNTYGTGFNANGGGVYVMERTSEAIKMWFFPRGSVPATVVAEVPDTATFGIPIASFQGDCDIDERFKDQHFMFSTNFCGTGGSGAGDNYDQSGCPRYAGLDGTSSCKKFVAENPSAFRNSYWQIASFRTFEKQTDSASSSMVSTISSAMVSSSSTSAISSSSTSAILSSSTSAILSSSTSAILSSSTSAILSSSSSDMASASISEMSSSLPTVSTSSTTISSGFTSVIPSSSSSNSEMISLSATSSSSLTTTYSLSSDSSISSSSATTSSANTATLSLTTVSTSTSASLETISHSSLPSLSQTSSRSDTTSIPITSSQNKPIPSTTMKTFSSALATPGLVISPDATCGGKTGFTCKGSKFGDCCSSYGWCGSTSVYCAKGCQSSFGKCSATSSSFLTRVTSTSTKIPTLPSSPTKRISTDGKCGGEARTTCQGSVYGNCCSKYGWCGSTAAYCQAGCNALFGSCR